MRRRLERPLEELLLYPLAEQLSIVLLDHPDFNKDTPAVSQGYIVRWLQGINPQNQVLE